MTDAPQHTTRMVAVSFGDRIGASAPWRLMPVLAVLGWLATGSAPTWPTLTVAGLTMAEMIFIMASGLTPVFGLMDVINSGHGAFILEGAFVGVTALGAMSGWVGRGRSR